MKAKMNNKLRTDHFGNPRGTGNPYKNIKNEIKNWGKSHISNSN